MSIPDVLIIGNPTSGKGRGRAVGEAVRRRLAERGASVQLSFGARKGDGQKMATQAVAEGVTRVVACGGDGTVHEVAGAVAASQTAMGIVPCGKGKRPGPRPEHPPRGRGYGRCATRRGGAADRSGGAWATSTSAPWRWSGSTRRSPEQSARMGAFQRDGGICVRGAQDALDLQEPSNALDRGLRDGGGPGLSLGGGNTSTYGGGMQIVPSAVPDDGELDVCIVHHLSRWKVLFLFPRVFSGTHVKLSAVEIRRTQSLRIECPTPMWIFGDGEPLCRTPATIEVVGKALNVICPRSGY